jgi:hypothetical protein
MDTANASMDRPTAMTNSDQRLMSIPPMVIDAKRKETRLLLYSGAD